MSQQNNKPIKSFRSGSIKVSVWRNETEKDGKAIVRFSTSIQKQFKNNKEEWQDTNVYFPEEIPRLRSLLRKAYDFIMIKESKDVGETVPV